MKLSRIELQGQNNFSLPILGALPTDQFILKGADGLGPSGVDVLISEAGRFQGRRPQNKEIVLKIGLNPNYNTGVLASDLRKTVYGLLSPDFGQAVSILLFDENNDEWAKITGHVKTIEPVIFSKDPEVQVVITCLSPYFRSPNQHGLLDSANKLNPSFSNVGSAPSGFYFDIDFTQATTNFTLTEMSGVRMHFNFAFSSGQHLVISTEPGNRYVSVNGDKSLIHYMDGWSKWLMLHPGTNVLNTSSQNFNYSSVYFVPKYWGI